MLIRLFMAVIEPTHTELRGDCSTTASTAAMPFIVLLFNLLLTNYYLIHTKNQAFSSLKNYKKILMVWPQNNFENIN